jgi:hypothetical protein
MKRFAAITVLTVFFPALIVLLAGCGDASGKTTTTTRIGGPTGESIVVVTTEKKPSVTTTSESTTTSRSPSGPLAVADPQAIVDTLAAVQSSGDIPAHFRNGQGDIVRDQSDYDVNACFAVLTHLSVEPGYVVDYLYEMEGIGGSPFVYARPADRAPYASVDEYAALTPDEGRSATGERDYSREYLNHVEIDDTREGYFEFVALSLLGDQFYLYWHAGYNDTTVICDETKLERVMSAAGAEFGGNGLPADVQSQARRIDLAPTVVFPDGSTAVVRLVTFTMWGGFIERKYTISRQFPHAILDEASTTLVEYDCGVMF